MCGHMLPLHNFTSRGDSSRGNPDMRAPYRDPARQHDISLYNP